MQPKKKKKKFIWIGVLLIAVVVAALFLFKPASKTAGYDTEIVKEGDITTYYSFSGNLAADEEKTVAAPKTLKIKEFYVKEGDKVNAGDLLYLIDDSDYAASIEQAQAAVELARVNLDSVQTGASQQQLMQAENAVTSAKLSLSDAEAALKRVKSLLADGIATEQAVEQAQSGYNLAKQQVDAAEKSYDLLKNTLIGKNIEAAEAQLHQAEAAYEAAKKQVGDTEITSEISGEVTKIYPAVNTTVQPGSPVMDITNYATMRAEVKVDEYDMSAVELGKSATVSVDALSEDFDGKIVEITKKASAMSGISYFTASVEVPDDPRLLGGMSVEVKVLNQSTKNASTLSMKALQFDNENHPFVGVLDEEGKIQSKPVTVGINDGLTVEIKEGLKPGDTVYYPAAKALTGFESYEGE